MLERYAPWYVQSVEIETLHTSTKMDNNKRILDAARDFRIASEMLVSQIRGTDISSPQYHSDNRFFRRIVFEVFGGLCGPSGKKGPQFAGALL